MNEGVVQSRSSNRRGIGNDKDDVSDISVGATESTKSTHSSLRKDKNENETKHHSNNNNHAADNDDDDEIDDALRAILNGTSTADDDNGDDLMLTDEEEKEMEEMARGRGRSETFHQDEISQSQLKAEQQQQRMLMTGNNPLPKKTLNIVSNLEAATKPIDIGASNGINNSSSVSVTVGTGAGGVGGSGAIDFRKIGESEEDLMEIRLAQMEENHTRQKRNSQVEANTPLVAQQTSHQADVADPNAQNSAGDQQGSVIGSAFRRSLSIFSKKRRTSLPSDGSDAATAAANHAKNASSLLPQISGSGNQQDLNVKPTAGGKDAAQTDTSFDEFFKILLLGDSGTGKTSLMLRIVEDSFKPNYLATAGVDCKVKYFNTNNNMRIKLQIWDTAGQERFRVVTRSYYKGAHAICLVFDVTDASSFSHVSIWLENIKNVLKGSSSTTPIILVGNKSDCPTQQRKVKADDAQAFARENEITYIETSARTGHNITELLEKATKEILGSRPSSKKSDQMAAASTGSSPLLEDKSRSPKKRTSEPDNIAFIPEPKLSTASGTGSTAKRNANGKYCLIM